MKFYNAFLLENLFIMLFQVDELLPKSESQFNLKIDVMKLNIVDCINDDIF